MAGDKASARHARAALVGCSALVALGGCTGPVDDTATHPSTSLGSTLSAGPLESTLPTAPTGTPAASSGALTARALPAAKALGPGWRLRVEGSDEEEGIGNGTAYQERDPREIVDTVLPMGCEQRSAGAVPVNVLQSTYALPSDGAYAVALRLRFDSTAHSSEFADRLHDDLRACSDQPDDPFSGAPAPVLAVSPQDGSYTSRYQLAGENGVWIKAVRVEGADVLTFDSDASPGAVDWPALGYQSP
jgi:hypothetical protein